MNNLTPEQIQIGKDNFNEAVNTSRRTFIKGAAAATTGLGALYFGYKELEGERVKVGFIGTGDEGNVLITQHPPEYMNVVAIADLRPANRDRAFHGDGNEHRVGLIKKLGEATAKKVQRFNNHKELLAAKDELGLEAVIIAVPLNQHMPIAMECLDAGLHVLTEKLMAHDITQCKEMISKARAKNLLLAVGHQRHYSVLYDNANELVRQGQLGDIRHIQAQWHRNNSFPGRDSWRKTPHKDDVTRWDDKDEELEGFGYRDLDQLVNWRLFYSTGGGLMAELGSHQMDAASIFLGKVHPLAVSGYGGKNFYGVKNVGSDDKQIDDREIDDHIYVTFEFPGAHYDAEKNPDDVCIVTYSSLNTNRFSGYGETVYGSRGTLMVKTEKEALLFKESSPVTGPGGPDQRLQVIDSSDGSGPVLDAYETTGPTPGASNTANAMGEKISRGYNEEMEHFCHCIRTNNYNTPKEGGLRCNGTVAMADAIMALTANLAMKHKKRIVFKPEWFDPANPAVPETDPDIVG
ncbi:MAG: dehydrogenase [Planctomycetaceae bacterium]|nr:dehydrogenase [Planctomycetaceae bacterium]